MKKNKQKEIIKKEVVDNEILLKDLSVKELIEISDQYKINLGKSKKKAEILKVIEKYLEANYETIKDSEFYLTEENEKDITDKEVLKTTGESTITKDNIVINSNYEVLNVLESGHTTTCFHCRVKQLNNNNEFTTHVPKELFN